MRNKNKIKMVPFGQQLLSFLQQCSRKHNHTYHKENNSNNLFEMKKSLK